MGLSRERFTATAGLMGNLGVLGVREPRDEDESFARFPFPSPSRTNVSIDFSKLPPSPFNTARFLLSSINPMSRNLPIFPARSMWPEPTCAPKTFDSLFLGGEGDRRLVILTGVGGSRLFLEDKGNIEEADLKPNLDPVFGGNGGGWSSEFELPVSCRAATACSWYFARINLSIAESASSISNGIGGLSLCRL